MVTDKGLEKALDGTYMHPATKVCPRDQMARSPDQHSSVLKHSASIRKDYEPRGYSLLITVPA